MEQKQQLCSNSEACITRLHQHLITAERAAKPARNERHFPTRLLVSAEPNSNATLSAGARAAHAGQRLNTDRHRWPRGAYQMRARPISLRRQRRIPRRLSLTAANLINGQRI